MGGLFTVQIMPRVSHAVAAQCFQTGCPSSLAPRRRTTCKRLKGCIQQSQMDNPRPWCFLWNGITLPKTNMAPESGCGWKTFLVSFLGCLGRFSGAMLLVLGRVFRTGYPFSNMYRHHHLQFRSQICQVWIVTKLPAKPPIICDRFLIST